MKKINYTDTHRYRNGYKKSTDTNIGKTFRRVRSETEAQMTPEGKVKQKIRNLLKKLGLYYFCPQTGGYGKSGVPDIIICAHGSFIAVECKAGSNKPTALQTAEMSKILSAAGDAWVVNEANFDSFAAWIETK